jgi:hypothetical protein
MVVCVHHYGGRGGCVLHSFHLLAFPVLLSLAGCAASREEVSVRLGSQYIGQNVDALVAQFGPPSNMFKMNSGDTSYVWQLSNQTDIRTSEGSGFTATRFCKVNVIASSKGVVTQLATEDSNAGGGLYGAIGLYGSICANRLGMQRQS